MKKVNCILNAVLIALILVGDAFYIKKGTLLIKSLTSACFVLLGLINLIYAIKNKTEQKKFCTIMTVGLFFAMLGDIILELGEMGFIIGALLFAVGHVFYFIAYGYLEKLSLRDLICGATIFVPAILLILLLPIFEFSSPILKWVCIIYAIIISCMTGKAISNFTKQRSLLNTLLMIGSIMFLFSDLMLLFDNFSSASGIFGLLCLISYYPAECVLANSLMHTKKSS